MPGCVVFMANFEAQASQAAVRWVFRQMGDAPLGCEKTDLLCWARKFTRASLAKRPGCCTLCFACRSLQSKSKSMQPMQGHRRGQFT